MLNLKDLSVAIQSVEILRGVNLNLPQGRMAGLIGRNGAGKTTLLRSVMGALPYQSGTITFDQSDLSKTPAHHRNQPRRRLYAGRSALSTGDCRLKKMCCCHCGQSVAKISAAKLQQVYGMIPEVEQFRDRRALQLSGGQQKLVALARALMSGTKLLLLGRTVRGRRTGVGATIG